VLGVYRARGNGGTRTQSGLHDAAGGDDKVFTVSTQGTRQTLEARKAGDGEAELTDAW
jgi:hypothetical protein